MKALIVLLLFSLPPFPADKPGRKFHPIKAEEMSKSPWTHVRTIAKVKRVFNEVDGDIHIDLDTKEKLVFECMPELPCKKPLIGDCIEGWGVWRMDPDHHWPEIHPLLGWREVPC